MEPIGNAVVVPALELRDIAVQMLLRAVLVSALHAALEDREAALNHVRVPFATAVLVLVVAQNLMRRELAANLHGIDSLTVINVASFANDGRHVKGLEAVNHHHAGLAAIGATRETTLCLWWNPRPSSRA